MDLGKLGKLFSGGISLTSKPIDLGKLANRGASGSPLNLFADGFQDAIKGDNPLGSILGKLFNPGGGDAAAQDDAGGGGKAGGLGFLTGFFDKIREALENAGVDTSIFDKLFGGADQ